MPTVLALGYEKRDVDEVLDLLEDHRIECLVDVRQNAFSRKPGFTKKFLAHALDQAGVEYVHLPALGCPKRLRDAKRDVGDMEAYVAGYRDHLRANAAAYQRLVALVRDRPTAILCMERKLADCHRQVLVDRLGRDGFEVVDLS